MEAAPRCRPPHPPLSRAVISPGQLNGTAACLLRSAAADRSNRPDTPPAEPRHRPKRPGPASSPVMRLRLPSPLTDSFAAALQDVEQNATVGGELGLGPRPRGGGARQRALRRVADDAWPQLQATATAALAWVIAKSCSTTTNRELGVSPGLVRPSRRGRGPRSWSDRGWPALVALPHRRRTASRDTGSPRSSRRR